MLEVLHWEFNMRSIPQTRDQFIEYYAKNKRDKLYQERTPEEYKKKIDSLLRSEIPPWNWHEMKRDELKDYLIGYEKPGSENLIVTHNGEKFITKEGYREESFRRFSRSSQDKRDKRNFWIAVAGIGVTVIGLAITNYITWLTRKP